MKSKPSIWSLTALLVAATAACGSEPQSVSAVATAPPAKTEVTAAPPETVVSPRAATPVVAAPAAATAPAASSPSVPLDKLLQLPGASAQRPAESDINAVLNRKPFVGPPEPGETAKERKLRLEIAGRTEAPIERHEVKREQVDAGAKVDVSKDTSIRGGVRVERDSTDSKSTNVGTTPSIGIEKRF